MTSNEVQSHKFSELHFSLCIQCAPNNVPRLLEIIFLFFFFISFSLFFPFFSFSIFVVNFSYAFGGASGQCLYFFSIMGDNRNYLFDFCIYLQYYQ